MATHLFLIILLAASASAKECIDAKSFYVGDNSKLYTGKVNYGATGVRCDGARRDQLVGRIYLEVERNNRVCRWSPPFYNDYDGRIPKHTAWCYGPDNQVIHCEVFSCLNDGPGTDYSANPFIGHTTIQQGPAKMINYFAQFPDFANHYYTYYPEYIDCVVTRTLPGEGYTPKRGIQSIYLRVRRIGGTNPRFSEDNKFGCKGRGPDISPGINHDIVRKYMQWNCTTSVIDYNRCAGQPCGEDDNAKRLFFANGRAPYGTHLDQERLRFVFQDRTEQSWYNHEDEADEMVRYFWGTLPSNDDVQRHSCESTITTDYPNSVISEELLALSQSYANSPAIPLHLHQPASQTHGYAEPKFSVRVTMVESPSPDSNPTEDNGKKVYAFKFTVTAGYDTQLLQIGVRYNYRKGWSREIGEVREFGCDTKGGVYHKNDPGWLNVANELSHTNESSMYYTASDSHCSALWPKIKIDVEHTLYMRIFTENAGNFTPFIKDGRSDTLYYLGNTEYITAKTVARWSNWIRNRVCPPVCNYPLERNRTCIPGVLGPMYDRYESWLLEPNCTVPSRDGSPAIANQLFDTMNYTNCNHFGLNCLNQEDFDEERSSMTAVAVFGGRTINLLAEPTGEYLRSFYHKYEHYNSYVERSSDNWPLPIPNAAVSYKDADYHFNKSDIRNIPRDKFDNFNVDERRTTTSVLTLIKGATGYIEWTIDLDNPAFGANDKIETLRVFKSQRIPEACWKSQRHPCQEFSRTGLWDVDNDAFGIDLSHDPCSHMFWLDATVKDRPGYKNYICRKNWTRSDSGRKTSATLRFSGVGLEDVGYYQIYLVVESGGSFNRYTRFIAIAPYLDLKVYDPVVQDDEIPGFQYPALSQPNRNYFQYTNVFPYTNRDLKTELGVYTLTVQQQNSRLYSINLYWKNLIIPPTDILKVEYLLGCKDLSDKVPVQIESKMRVQGNPESYYENFRPVYYTFELNIEQQGADLFNNMEHLDVLFLMFEIKYRDQVYSASIYRRLFIKDATSSPYEVPEDFVAWPDNMEGRTPLDVYVNTICRGNLAVDGGWSEPVVVSRSGTCGQVTERAERYCTNPRPRYGGSGCAGSPIQIFKRTLPPCPVPSTWGNWRSWSSCSQTCGVCSTVRRRICSISPTPGESPYCEGSERLDNAKSSQTLVISHQVVCATYCQMDDECQGLFTRAFCASAPGTPKSCRFECKDSLQCTNGICTAIMNDLGEELSVCLDQCQSDSHCSNSEVCVARRCVTKCNSTEGDEQCGAGEICSKINGYCTTPCSGDFSCRRALGPLGSCFQVDPAASNEECVMGCRKHKDCSSNDYICILGVCLHVSTPPSAYDGIDCSSCPQTAVCVNNRTCIGYDDSYVCGEGVLCGESAECKEGSCHPLYNMKKACTKDSDCSYLERCSATKECTVLQWPNGDIATPVYNDCGSCRNNPWKSSCAEDGRCKCSDSQRLYSPYQCGNEDDSRTLPDITYDKGQVLCEPDSETLECSRGEVISLDLNSIEYNFVEDEECAKSSSKKMCTAERWDILAELTSECAGKQSCTLHASRSNYMTRRAGANHLCPPKESDLIGELSFRYACIPERSHFCVGESCLLGCRADNHCGYNQRCHRNLCRASCLSNTNSSSSDVSCPAGSTCEDQLCKTNCVSDSNCFPTQVCFEGLCQDQCGFDEDCPGHYICSGGLCTLGCSRFGSCHGKRVCLRGKCLQPCSSSGDCASGYPCLFGICTTGCKGDVECSTQQLCQGGACLTRCYNESSCPNGYRCSSGLCLLLCFNPDFCGSDGWQCRSGICIRSCVSKEDCHPSQVCLADGSCGYIFGVECREDAACNLDPLYHYNRCENKMCVASFAEGANCKTSEDCGQIGICISFKCSWPLDNNGSPVQYSGPKSCKSSEVNTLCTRGTAGSRCLNERTGRHECLCEDETKELYQRCAPFVQSCQVTSNCPYNEVCIHGQCYVNCAEAEDVCHKELVCLEGGVCGYSCLFDSQCPYRTTCFQNKCELKCNIRNGGDNPCVAGLQECIGGICVGLTQPDECPNGTVYRHDGCVQGCLRDSECPDICVVGGCSSSCSTNKPCPTGYSCMGGRCFAKCDISEFQEGKTVCGASLNYACLLGLSEPPDGVGLCTYKSIVLPQTELDQQRVSHRVACDIYARSGISGCGSILPEGFLIGGVLATACFTDFDCSPNSLHCIAGFCTTFCDTKTANKDHCLSPQAKCIYSNPVSLKSQVCHVSCEEGRQACPRTTYCGTRNGFKVCIQLNNIPCTIQYDCIDAQRSGTFLCQSGKCIPTGGTGEPCVDNSECGEGLHCDARVCVRIFDGDNYKNKLPEFNSTSGGDYSEEDGNTGPCAHHGIQGLIYNHSRGLCICKYGAVEFGNRCQDSNGPRELDFCYGKIKCPSHMVCVSSRCLLRCSSGCGKGAICKQGVCERLCFAEEECPQGMRCWDGSCTAACKQDRTRCGTGRKCIGDLCYEFPFPSSKQCDLTYIAQEQLCLPTCVADEECDEMCLAGFCSHRCSANYPCTTGRACVGGRCIMLCDRARKCAGASQSCVGGFCLPICQSDYNCPELMVCAKGVCTVQCETDWECGDELKCIGSLCTADCVNRNCTNGYTCKRDTLACHLECTDNSECASHQSCDSSLGTCVSVQGESCDVHGDCDSSFRCHPEFYCSPVTSTCSLFDKSSLPCNARTCGVSEVCNGEGFCQNRIISGQNNGDVPCLNGNSFNVDNPSNESCWSDEECSDAGEFCIANTCYLVTNITEVYGGCSVSPHPQRAVASDGVITITCESDSWCAEEQICVHCTCSTTCNINLHCSSNQTCFGGVCMEKCSATSSCTSSVDDCIDGICRDTCADDDAVIGYGACAGGIVSLICDSQNWCPFGYVCENFLCEKLCEEDSDCGSSQMCTLSLCRGACDNEESIRCANGTEVGRCYTTADCGENFVCSYGVCSPPCTCTRSSCRGPPCDEETGWYCDPDSLGCIHDSVVNITDDGSHILNTNCSLDEDCNHYNLYCNQKTGTCHFLSKPEGEVRCTVTDISKCGFNGECLNGRCDCVRNGADECVASEPPVSCQSDRYLSCPANLKCHEMHDLCACPLGTILLGSECIEMTGKDGSGPHFTRCGMHSQCSANSSCVSGNCYPHCTDVCTEYPSFSCIEGLCALGCSMDSDCDVHQFCEANSKACSIRCTNHSECARGQYCEGGQCLLSCIEGYECAEGSVCRRHICVRTCTLDHECPQACVQGICGLSCKSSVDCAPGESCQMGLCLDSCTQDDSCAPTQVCIQGYCSKKCKAYADGCREECADNSQCAENLQCHEGVCAGQCSVDTDCGNGFSCINGLCRISCSGSDLSITYCPSHLFCDFSTELCQTSNGTICLSPSDCTNTQYCHGQLCINGVKIGTSCLSDSDCGVEEYCVDSKCDCLHGFDGECVDYPVSCTSDVGASACADKLPGSVCDPVRNWCLCELPDYQRLGDRCASPVLETCVVSCEPGYECRGKRCYQLCAAESSGCPAGLTCVNGYCDYGCSKDSNCNLQQKCECGMCVHICSSNSDCLTGQRCHGGVCREACTSTGLGSPCRPNYLALCTSDADCPPTGFCFNSYCQDGCTRGDVQCSTSGFSCQDDVCLKICDSEVSCLLLDSQVETGCGCPTAGISYDDCLLYSPFCPPTRFLPDGFTLTPVEAARECDELISNSVCDDETGQCVCPRGMVQYGGAVCQLALNGCDEVVLCELADICLEGYCFKRCSRSSDCPSKTYCSQTEGVCLLQCLTDDQCLGYQTCQEDGYCLSNPGYVPVDKAQDPQCLKEGDRYKCPKDLFENCVDGECECLDGMQRSTVNLECELKIDTVCLKCDPCLDGSVPCADANMYCNIVRLCICKAGFKLDESGEVCVKDDEPISEIDCRTDADCVRLPNSYCNSDRGKCQCLENHCYDEKYCRLDVNECTNTTCVGGSTCVEMDCVGPSPGTCVPEKYLTAIPTTKFICAVDDDCYEYLGPYSYCFAERCTCVVTTSLLIDGACQPIGTCSRDVDCPPSFRCNFGLCLAVPDLPRFERAIERKPVLKKTDYVGILVACVLAVGIVATTVVTIYLRNEYLKKNSAALDEKEGKELELNLEARKSQIAVKRDALETKRIASQANVAAGVPQGADPADIDPNTIMDVVPIPRVQEPLESKSSTHSTRASKKTKSAMSMSSKKKDKSSEKLPEMTSSQLNTAAPNRSHISIGNPEGADEKKSKSVHSYKTTKSKNSKSSMKSTKSKGKESTKGIDAEPGSSHEAAKSLDAEATQSGD